VAQFPIDEGANLGGDRIWIDADQMPELESELAILGHDVHGSAAVNEARLERGMDDVILIVVCAGSHFVSQVSEEHDQFGRMFDGIDGTRRQAGMGLQPANPHPIGAPTLVADDRAHFRGLADDAQ
jgi:hypothetical protein